MNKYAALSPDVIAILRDKETELPYSGACSTDIVKGTYLCSGCGLALFRADSQFSSGCGWPSFDDEIPNTIIKHPDADGHRTEIICAHCQGHLGHIFLGEGYTSRNVRYCVNSLAMEFVSSETVVNSEEAIIAAGCFWGVQYYMDRLPGVLKTEVGYIGGHTTYPTYQEVCNHTTGHVEAIRVLYDPLIVSYQSVIQYFFEIHDFEQTNGQGPDIGPQYQSAIFYFDDDQKYKAEQIIAHLKNQGWLVATALREMNVFWRAEIMHQSYYQKHMQTPYCHRWVAKF